MCHPAALHNRTQRPARPTSYAGRCGPRGQQATGADDGRMEGGAGGGWRGKGAVDVGAQWPSPRPNLISSPPLPRAHRHAKEGPQGLDSHFRTAIVGGGTGGAMAAWRNSRCCRRTPVVPRRRRVRLTARCVVCNAHSFIGRGVGGHNNPGSTAQHRGAARASPGMMPGEPVVSSPAGGSADGTAAAAPAAAAAAAAAPGPDLARA